MTVAELIALLQRLEPSLPVYVWENWNDFPVGEANVEAALAAVVTSDGVARPRRLVLYRAEA